MGFRLGIKLNLKIKIGDDNMINTLKNIFSPYKGLPREIYVIFISRIINNLGCFVHPLLALILTEKIGLRTEVAGIYITVLSVLSGPMMMVGGKLTDTIGRRKLILLGQGFGAIALIVCGLMKPTIFMVYVIMVSSLLYTMVAPAYDALLADLTDDNNRKVCYSLVYMGLNIGFAIGPMIGGMLFSNYLNLVFIGDGITTLLSVVLMGFYVKETKGRDIKFTVDETRVEEKEVEGSVFSVLIKRPILLYFSLILLLYSFQYSQWGFSLPLNLTKIFDKGGAHYYGILAAINGFVVIILTPIISKVTHSIKPIRVIAMGGACYTVAFSSFAFIKSFPLFCLAIVIMTMGEILVNINSSAFIAGLTPSSHRGRVSGVLPMISGLGYAVGPMVMGSVISNVGMFYGWIIIGIIGVVSTSMMFMLGKVETSYRIKLKQVECEI